MVNYFKGVVPLSCVMKDSNQGVPARGSTNQRKEESFHAAKMQWPFEMFPDQGLHGSDARLFIPVTWKRAQEVRICVILPEDVICVDLDTR